MNPTQLNIFLFLVLSILGVAVLSQHYRFNRFSPLAMIIMQYMIAEIIILASLKIASFFVDIHPDGYRDMTLSFSVPYLIGALIYYIRLRLEVKDRLLVDEKKLKASGAAGVIRPGKTSVQVIIGPKVQFVADEFKKLL